MNLTALESLVAVIDSGSIAKAAMIERVSASAISQRLQALETELGVRLLVRSGRTVLPTPTCTRLLPQIRQLLEQSRDLTMSLSQITNTGRFHLGAISTVLGDYIAQIIHLANQQMPDLDLEIQPGTSAQLYQDFQDGKLDAILCVSPAFALPKSQTFAPLKKQPIGVISSPDHHRQNAPYILYNRKAWGGKTCWNTLTDITKTPRILCELDALETIAIMVQRGLGQAVVPKWDGLMQRFGDLEFKRIGNQHRELGLLCRTHQFDHPALDIIHSAMG